MTMFNYSLTDQFTRLQPGAFFLDTENPIELTRYLLQKNLLKKGEEIIKLEKAGAKGMSLIVRATTQQRTFIIKQARPWLENNPAMDASPDRIDEECGYYRLVSTHPVLKQYHPQLIHFDETSHLLVLSDMGTGGNYKYLYEKQTKLSAGEVNRLVEYLVTLHTDFSTDMVYDRIYNRDIRKMNFDNIFVSPFHHTEKYLNAIQPGLRDVAAPFVEDRRMIDEIKYLGRLYESDGTHLIHGDFYPGSWVQTSAGIKINDAEHCFFGPVEYDLGVLIAHLLLSQQPEQIITAALNTYKSHLNFNPVLMIHFAGVEVLRRIIEQAKLPLFLDLQTIKAMMVESRKMLLSHDESYLWDLMKE